jgi:hypothetical protein
LSTTAIFNDRRRICAQLFNAEKPIVSFTEAHNVLATLAWMFPDVMVKRLEAAIAAEQDDDAALSHEARELPAAKAQGDLLSVEHDIASLVWRGLDQGLPVSFGDISAPAILGAQLVTLPAGDAGGPSREHVIEYVGQRR